MPVSNPEFRRKLALAGENPDEYDDPIEPNVKPEAATNKQGFLESLSAAGSTALRESPSTALGISAGAGITGLTSSLGPVAPFLGLAGGTTVGILSRMGQDPLLKSVLPTSMYDAYKAREKQDTEQHSVASKIGSIIPQTAAFRLSPTGIINAGKALISPAKDEATKLIEQQALKHVLVNAGTQAGVGIGSDIVMGNEITPKGVGENLLMGGFLNKPTALGKKLMFERPISEAVKPVVSIPETDIPDQTLADKNISNNTGEVQPDTKINKEADIAKADAQVPQVTPSQSEVKELTKQQMIDSLKGGYIHEEVLKHLDETELKSLVEKAQLVKPDVAIVNEAVPNVETKLEQPIIQEEIKQPIEEVKPTEVKVEEPTKDITKTEEPTFISQNQGERVAHLYGGRSEIDKLSNIGKGSGFINKDSAEPNAKLAAKGLTDLQEKHTEYLGQLLNPFQQEVAKIQGLKVPAIAAITKPLDYIRQEGPEAREAMKFVNDTKEGRPTTPLSQKASDILKAATTAFDKVRAYAIKNAKTLGHEAKDYTEGYFPEPIDKDVSAELKNNPESDKSKQLRQEFIDKRTDTYVKQGKNQVEANKIAIGDLASIENSWKGTGFKVANSGASEFFGPLDKAHGLGLPESWRPKSLTDTVTQYLNSSAKRMAYHDAVQLKPDVQKALDIYSGNKHVQAIIGTITSNKMNEQTLFKALTGFVSRTVMGPISGAKEIMSAPFLGWQHLSNPAKAITYTTKALMEVPTSVASLWRTGRIQKHQNVLELGQYNNDYLGGLKDLMTEKGAIRALNRATNIASDFTGKNIGDKIGRALNFGQGKYAFLDAIKELDNNKLSGGAKLFLQTFAHDIDLSKSIGQAETDKVGSRYVDSIQGTYDSRGLPRQVMDGSFTSSMLQLARWNVEKSNNYMKYAITPLINGNPKPFLMSTLGVALGGSMVTLITEAISKRKQNVATLDELKASKEMGKDVTMDAFYKASALVSAAGHTGWLGDTLKAILDAAYGKTRPQFYNQILLQATTDAANVIKSFADNVRENGFTKELAFDAVAKILANNFQTYRIIETYMSQDKQLQIDKSNKLRDLRVFNTLEGNKLKDLSSPFQTKLVDPAMDKYKKASINDAVKMIPELIQRAKENSKGDPMRLIEELKKIKGDSFNTIPNPDTTEGALAFKRYKTFLSKTQGINEANNRIKEYEMQKAINEAKAVYK